MFKIVFILAFFVLHVVASEFYINPYFLNKVEKNSISYNILKDYERFLNSIKNDNKETKIKKVNFYINQIVPRYDANNYNTDEYWATPFEFFSNIGGDCEDYVIAKMYTLEKLGIHPKDMYMNVVKEKFIGGKHMVLNLHVDKNRPQIVLDNLSSKVLPINKRVDLESVFMFNKYGFYILENFKDLKQIKKINLLTYRDFKTRNKHELILQKKK